MGRIGEGIGGGDRGGMGRIGEGIGEGIGDEGGRDVVNWMKG